MLNRDLPLKYAIVRGSNDCYITEHNPLTTLKLLTSAAWLKEEEVNECFL